MRKFKYYVYTLAYPDETVFYVGKGSGSRMYVHEAEARRGAWRKRHEIIRSIWEQGGQVLRQVVFETDNEQLACEREVEVIAQHSKTLANVAHNIRVNSIVRYGREGHVPTQGERLARAIERAFWLNRQRAAGYPEHQREELLKVWDEQSVQRLKRTVE